MNKKTVVIIIISAILLFVAVWGTIALVSMHSASETVPEEQTQSEAPPRDPDATNKLPADEGLGENRYKGEVVSITDTQITINDGSTDKVFVLTEKTAQHIPLLEIGVGDKIIVEVEPGTTTVKLFEKILSES